MLKRIPLAFVAIVLACLAMPAQARVVTLVATEWIPFTGDTLPGKGFLTEITLEALRRAGHEPQLTFAPWKRALEMARAGEVDGLIGASYAEERTGDFVYPRYFRPSALYFFTRASNNVVYTRPEALCPAVLGLLRGSFLEERFKSVPCLQIDLAAEVEQNLRKLSAGRLDYILESRDAVLFLLAGPLRDVRNLKPVEPPYEIDKVYTVFSRKKADADALAAAFDAGVDQLEADGSCAAILQRYGLR